MEAKKRLFLGLVTITVGLSALVLFYLSQLIFTESNGLLTEIFIFVVSTVVIIFTLVFTLGLIGILLTIVNAKNYPLLDRWIGITLNLFYPVVIFLGRVFQITKDKIQKSFVEVNNQLVEVKTKEYQGKLSNRDILVLLPHCLQNSTCPHRITLEIDNCAQCGQCTISALIDLSEKYQIPVRVATGGTLARKVVKKFRPKTIIAVACERDLTSGILDTNPLPVMGIVNDRPYGPCFDTSVDLERVEDTIKYFIEGGD